MITIFPGPTRGSEDREKSMKFLNVSMEGEEAFWKDIVQGYQFWGVGVKSEKGGNYSQFVLMLQKYGLHCGYRVEKEVDYKKYFEGRIDRRKKGRVTTTFRELVLH